MWRYVDSERFTGAKPLPSHSRASYGTNGITRGITGTLHYGAPRALPGHFEKEGLQGSGELCKVPPVGRFHLCAHLPEP